MPQVRVVTRNLLDMLATFPTVKLDKLYESFFICVAVLRSFPPLAKKYVLQMFFIDSSVTTKFMEEWVLADGYSKHRVAIDMLLQLRVFIELNDGRKETGYKMNPKFQSNMQKYLVHGATLPREPMSSSITGRLPSLEELESYALEQWEVLSLSLYFSYILLAKYVTMSNGFASYSLFQVIWFGPSASNFMFLRIIVFFHLGVNQCFLLQLISSAQAERLTNFSSSMLRVFQRGLLSSRENGAATLIKNGFQFLLMETNAQLWYIVGEYISSSEDCGVDPTDLISFLLELSFHTMGKAYNLSTLTDVQRNAIKDLASLGLVKLQQGRKERWFILTKLATTLSVSLSDKSARKQGYVVVETNFKIYAYSTSKLHYEILRLFSRIEYQLPNLIAGSITKESVDNAFEKGITSEQIISYLQQNAHPRVAEKTTAVPENVTDMIRLWEANRNRVGITPCHLYEDFPSKDVFEAACDFARELGGLFWEDSKKMRLIVNEELHQAMQDFLRRQEVTTSKTSTSTKILSLIQ